MKKIFLTVLVTFGFVPKITLAHCPLCTAGAGALAILAASFGVSSVVVGVMIGAFALALNLWFAKIIKKEYFKYQSQILVVVVFLSTVVPIMPLVQDYGPLYVSLVGEYGTFFHNTYVINLYLLGVVIGAFVMAVSPFLSRFLTKLRKKQIPFQGISITFLLLVLVSVIIQILS